jgi:signal transduction histidine kinase
MRPESWLRAVGVGTWFVTALPTAVAIARGELGGGRAIAFVLAALVFFVAFVAACRTPDAKRLAAIAERIVQSGAAIAMLWLGRDAVIAATFVVVAAQLPGAVNGRVAVAWVIGQSVALAVRVDAVSSGPGLASCAAFLGFQAFALATAALAASERRAREALADHVRTAERLRVARDLHDTLGHHLTALGLQLEVAERLADGRARDHIERAHTIGRLLLADVRGVVSDLREPRPLGVALRAAVATAGELAVHLDIAGELESLVGEQTEALTRCVQELVTNTVRHADARNLWIAVTADRAVIRLLARDDGKAGTDDTVAWGNGLTGMRERFTELGGAIGVRCGSRGGFEVDATMARVQP